MPQLEHLPADAGIERILEVIRRDGALILDGVLTPAQIGAFLDRTGPYMEATRHGSDDFTGRSTTRTGALVARSPTARELVMHDTVLAAANRFLEPWCMRIQLHLTQIIRLKPGQGSQQIHRDRWAWGKFMEDMEPQLNTIWAMTDFTEENGATRVAPGSVDWPDDRLPEPAEICQATMKAGSVLLYTGSVFHGGGENRSDRDRIGVNLASRWPGCGRRKTSSSPARRRLPVSCRKRCRTCWAIRWGAMRSATTHRPCPRARGPNASARSTHWAGSGRARASAMPSCWSRSVGAECPRTGLAPRRTR
ncbi:MAG: phytanoyl-CoA dioxygenase family protein [Gammaproteobacteria bacterium]|nr:phytanoyl-CoA dioxygenase family protein [Gammaproteobacteria bacterium]